VTPERLLARRLANQHLADTRTANPAELVAHFGAVQAQEYGQALWAVGLRTSRATVGTVEAAVERGEILRTWPMRARFTSWRRVTPAGWLSCWPGAGSGR